MGKLTVRHIANYFDEIEEDWLTPFDWNPNKKLPHDQQYTYRIKDLFIATYHNKICRYDESEEAICKTKFHFIFRYNIMHVFQVHDEINKLKMMADPDHYEKVTSLEKTINTNGSYSDTSSNTNTNNQKNTDRAGSLAGSMDAIQLGAALLDPSLTRVDTAKLPEVFDENMRGYSQNVNTASTTIEGTVSDNATSSGTNSNTNTQNAKNRISIEALNQVRAHSLQVRRVHEEFVQCFNVLFY